MCRFHTYLQLVNFLHFFFNTLQIYDSFSFLLDKIFILHADHEQNAGTTKTRTGGKVGLAVVSSAVSSTPIHDLEHSTMFHDVSKLDHNTGILHANHPDDQEEAEQHQERTGRPEHVGMEVHSKRNLSKLGLKESSKI